MPTDSEIFEHPNDEISAIDTQSDQLDSYNVQINLNILKKSFFE